MLNEHWQDIIGYEGLYKISSIGNVYSIRNKKLLKQNTMNKGYHTVKLQNNGVKKMFRVHRLVAITFIPNPNLYKEVNPHVQP